MNTKKLTIAAVAALTASLALTACEEGDAASSAAYNHTTIAPLPGTDLAMVYSDGVAVRALVDTDRNLHPDVVTGAGGRGVQYATVDAVATPAVLNKSQDLEWVLAPNGVDVWALTPAQYAAHPDLVRVIGFIQ